MSSKIMPIIPYLISFLFQDNLLSKISPVYTFNVHMNTFLINKSAGWNDNAVMLFDLKCQLIFNNFLRCYIPKSSVHYSAGNDYQIDYMFTPSTVEYSNTNFTMEFDDVGVKMLTIDKTDDNGVDDVLMFYAMLGDLLSIGAQLNWKEKLLIEVDRNMLITCPTYYELLEANHSPQLNYTLRSFTHDDNWKVLQKESVDIRKYRLVQECCSICNHILGMNLWTDLFLTTDFTVKMTHSASQMLLDKHYFYSTTHNYFDLYDWEGNLVGNVTEKFEVTLWTVDT